MFFGIVLEVLQFGLEFVESLRCLEHVGCVFVEEFATDGVF